LACAVPIEDIPHLVAQKSDLIDGFVHRGSSPCDIVMTFQGRRLVVPL
jgi:hypothetical protein